MDKIKTQRNIFLFILLGFLILNFSFGIVNGYFSYDFKKWIWDTYSPDSTNGTGTIKISKPSLITQLLLTFAGLVIWVVFFALTFNYNKSPDERINKRKWPYIVILVFSSIGLVLGFWHIFKDAYGVVSFGSVTLEDKTAILAKMDNSYQIILASKIISMVLITGIIAFSTLSLIWINKTKPESDFEVTNNITQTGIEE